MKKLFSLSMVFFLSFVINSVKGQNATTYPTMVKKAVYSDVSQPLRDLPLIAPSVQGTATKEIPNKIGKKEFNNLVSNGFSLPEDPVWQKQNGTRQFISKAPLQKFEGVGNLSGVYPPDTQGDVGPDHYVQVVNLKFMVFSKTGTPLLGPADLKTIWTGIPSPWNNTNNGDPIVLYDQAADRWVISQFSLPNSTQYAELIAISQTSDPTGAWYRYVFEFGSNMPDYPKLGVWNDGYYLSANQFLNASTWAGVGACALERSKMLVGDPNARMVYFNLSANSDPGSMLPSDWDGINPPDAGEPNHFTYFNDWSSSTNDYLKIWDFHVDWTLPENSTFAEVASLTTAPFDSELCTADRGRCIPQPETTVKLESLSDRLMYRLQYRNFDTHRSMVTNHTVDVDGTGHAGIRWYEIRNTGSGWAIYQQGTYAPDASNRWVGSIAMNSVGDMALGYSVSNSSNVYPSIRYTGRLFSDLPNQMTIAEQSIISGSGSQTGPAARWGDYSMMSVDPVDDGTFWFTTEYIQTTGNTTWKTYIASFLFGPILSVANFIADNTKPCLNSTVLFTDQSSGNPTSWSWSVTPATYAFMDETTSSCQNPHIQFTDFDNYTIELTASNSQGGTTKTKTNYITVNEANSDFSASQTFVYKDDPTTFTDASTCADTSWLWDFGTDATPATAITQGPHNVTYNTIGQKTVSLTVNGEVTETKTNFISVNNPVFNIGNNTIYTCTGNFYDSGGVTASYQDKENFTETFYPSSSGSKIRFDFTTFDTDNYDYLRIYNGTSTSAPLIGTYHGNTGPGTVIADNTSGALTFNFTSDFSVSSSGWAAAISCYSTVFPPVADFSASSIIPSINTKVSFTDLSTNYASSWTWCFNPDSILYVDNTNSASQNPKVQFTSTGQYSVSLTATNANGSNTKTKSGFINATNCSSCTSSSTNANLEWISNVTFNTINNSSAGEVGYQDFTMVSTNVLMGNTYNLSVTCEQTGIWIEHCFAFFDWNHDCDFTDSGESFDLGQVSGSYSTNLNITIPLGALAGATRMRITLKYNSDPNSCEAFYFGQVEDYTVIIQNPDRNLHLTLFLEGLFNGSVMKKAQNATGNQFPGSIADKIAIELHNATEPFSLVGGPYIVELDTAGAAWLPIPFSLGANYYIVVKHRNSIETWSAYPVSFGNDVITYNFTTSSNQASGNNLKFMSGKYLVFGGDVNQDGAVDANDLVLSDNASANFALGYLATDANGDGVINKTDVNLITANSKNYVKSITP